MAKQQIVSRFNSAKVLFECEIPEDVESGLAMRHALEKAVEARADLRGAYLGGADLGGADLGGADLRGADLGGAYLGGADLGGADLGGADLRGAYLGGADLGGAYLRGADLRGADLRGAYLGGADLKTATPEQSVENLDKVRAIVLDNRARLEMGHWHQDDGWKARTCAEETLCETTHCLAGWLQVCSTDPAIRDERDPQMAGIKAAPIAAKMFFRQPEEVFSWLDERKYVGEIAEREQRAAERAAKKVAGSDA
jgi:hypothetical protein